MSQLDVDQLPRDSQQSMIATGIGLLHRRIIRLIQTVVAGRSCAGQKRQVSPVSPKVNAGKADAPERALVTATPTDCPPASMLACDFADFLVTQCLLRLITVVQGEWLAALPSGYLTVCRGQGCYRAV